MASHLIRRGDVFPATTSVGAYQRSVWPAAAEAGPKWGTAPPAGATADNSQTVDSAGTLPAFTGLVENTQYVAGGQVGGSWRYVGFFTAKQDVTGSLLGTLTKTDADFTTTSSTGADVTGLTGLTFTAPPSGNVEVVLTASALLNATATNFAAIKIVMDAATDIVQSQTHTSTAANQEGSASIRKVVTGLVPGSQHTLKAVLICPFGLGTAKVGVAATKPLTLSVREAG